MGLVQIDSLEPGMSVGADVTDASGQVLLKSGVELTEKHLRVLRSWGVTQVEISGVERIDPDEQLLAQAHPLIVQQAEKETTELFQTANREHPAVAELARLTTLRIVKTLVQQSQAS